MRMRAVVEATAFADAEEFGEIMRYLLPLHLKRTEAFDPWGVNKVAIGVGERKHLREGCGVHPLEVS